LLETLPWDWGILTLALGAAGTFFGYLARDQGRIGRWQARRGEAEIARLAVFTTIGGKGRRGGSCSCLAQPRTHRMPLVE
jgi:hypothetical protein